MFLHKKRVVTILLFVIIFLGFIVRFYGLGRIPLGLNNDEAAIGYNAFSILTTGKDEYGVRYPLYFRSFDDYKLPVYIYLTAAAIKIFGANEFAVRFASFLFGTVTIISIYFLVLTVSKRKGLALLASFLLAINPWHIFFSRVGSEVNVAISLLTLGVLFFFLAKDFKKYSPVLLFASVLFFVLSLYCYNVTRLMSPLIFLSLLFFYRSSFIHSKSKYVPIVSFLLSMIPFLISFKSGSGFSTQTSVFIFGGESLVKIIELRSYLVALPQLLIKSLFNTFFLTLWQYLKNIIDFFSFNFFFVNGASHPINGVGNSGMFHLIEAITIPVGICFVIKKKIAYLFSFFLWMGIVIIVGCLTIEVPHATRTYGIIIPFIVFSAFGVLVIYEYTKRLRNHLLANSFVVVLIGVFFYSFLHFLASYFFMFPVLYAKTWRSEDKKLVQYIQQNERKYKKIIIDESIDFNYSSLLFHSKFLPEIVQKEAVYASQGLLATLIRVGKYEFRKVDWSHDLSSPGILFIAGSSNVPVNKKPLIIFYYPMRPVVVYYDNRIGQFPANDIAYELFESN